MHGSQFATRRVATSEAIDWLGLYNAHQLHSMLDHVSPMAFGKTWFAAQKRKDA